MDREAFSKKEFVPAVIGAGVSLFFSRSGLLGIFFLLPLGFLAFRYGHRIAWGAVFIAVSTNTVFVLGTAAMRGVPLSGSFLDILYFAVMACLFTWIITPPPETRFKVCGTVRLIIGSCVASFLLVGTFLRVAASPVFLAQIASVTDMPAEVVLGFFTTMMLRGGALIFSVLLFFLCRQISFIIARFSTRKNPSNLSISAIDPLELYRTPPVLVWVLSGALLLVVFASMANLEIPGIILWNILILCGIMYFAHGMGILLVFLTRPTISPFLRLLLSIGFVFLLLSPGINAVLVGGVALLGVAENWVPLRAPKSNRPPSTPEAGDGN